MNFSPDAKKIKVVFVCDACGEDTIIEEIIIPDNGSITLQVDCPVCFKEFTAIATRGNIEIEDAENIRVTIL